MTRSRAAELLEKISRIIPGMAGYQEREKRREADRAVRAQAALEVSRCRERLSEAMNDLSRAGGAGNLRALGTLDRLMAKFERVEDELRFAPSGYAGWFDGEGITLEDLEKIYEYDLGLLSAAKSLVECIVEEPSPGASPEWTRSVETALDDLRDAFNGRRKRMEIDP